ncbi:MAG: sulfatase-like hydrolase/transferase [Oxalobacter formigenes]|nr:sulfatase-like hydrolase/transferase [Oxalobacter formigenes]
MQGSHQPYHTRFPDHARYWHGGTGTHEKQLNDYDNSIRYTDYVISQYIAALKKAHGVNYLLYLADHGEEAGNDKNSCFCHNAEIASDAMFKIPFILWLSPEYRKTRPEFVKNLNHYLGRGFNTQHFPHALMNLSGLNNPDIQPEKSLFFPLYREPHPLIIR